MLKIQKKISPYNHYNGGNNVQYIVLHDVGALGQAKANVDYFYSANRGASAHLFVDETSIWQSVEFSNPAFHVGDDKKNDQYDVGDLIHNRNSIGIEMCLDKNWKVTAKTKANTVELVNYLLKLYPNAVIVRHYDASGKNCPGSMSGNNWNEWNQFKAQIKGYTAPSTPTKVNAPDSHKVVNNDTLWGLSKQYNVSVAQLKEWNSLKSDTINVGQVLKLKKGAATPSKVVSKPSKKFNLPSGNFSKTTHQNTYSAAVLTIQNALSAIYYYPNKGAKNNGCDGYFGAKTDNAVRRFQSVYGLKVDGIFGENCRKKLDSLVNK